MWFHISKDYLGKTKILMPKVTNYNSITTYEEGNIPHICVADSIFNCLCAIVGDCKPNTSNFLRQFTKNPSIYFTEEIAFLPPNAIDFRVTNEHWFLKRTKFFFLGKLDMYHFLKYSEIIPTDIDKFMIPKKVQKYYTPKIVKERFLEKLLKIH